MCVCGSYIFGFIDVKPDVSEKYFFDSSFFSAAFGLMISRPLRGVKATEEAIPLELSRPIVVLCVRDFSSKLQN